MTELSSAFGSNPLNLFPWSSRRRPDHASTADHADAEPDEQTEADLLAACDAGLMPALLLGAAMLSALAMWVVLVRAVVNLFLS